MFGQITTIECLFQAWRKVRANRGAAGIDAVGLHQFERNLAENLRELSTALQAGTYQPLPARFVRIAKENGKMRELGILTVRDRVAQRATLDAIEPIFEPKMSDCNFAFRPNRNVEMAIQRVVLARANGAMWTVESDVRDFFPSIDCDLLLREVERKISDKKVLALLQLWLDAGMLTETAEAASSFWRKTNKTIAEYRDLLGETVEDSLSGWTSGRSVFALDEPDLSNGIGESDFGDETFFVPQVAETNETKMDRRRGIVKRLLGEGLMFAVANRALIGRLAGAKLLGVGGLAIAAFVFTPSMVEAAQRYWQVRRGVLQGAPVSPLLANIYLTAFDERMTAQNFRLVRYCDDFVVSCQTQAEAENALRIAVGELNKRKLTLHPEKTRIVPPQGEFEFLGYRFLADGSVMPPPTVPEKIAKQIRQMSLNTARNVQNQAAKLKPKKFKINNWNEYFDFLRRKQQRD